jgi:dihydrofolate synthase/folylpolyglutamate synthase
MTYKEALDFLFSQLPMYQRVGKSAYKKDLSNTIHLCKYLNHPERKFKSIHIAGTNGKGTTAHILSSVFQEAGYTTGLYTSPHLKSFTERIKINGIDISEEFVTDFVVRIKKEILNIQPSFFEITVAMAFDYFAKQNVDIAIIETGLGGRLDSTNVIQPELAVITNIALDHQEMLGNTIKEIAREKGGIIKENIPLVLGLMSDGAKDELVEIATRQNAKINLYFSDYQIERTGSFFNVHKNGKLVFQNIKSGIQGDYIKKIIPHVLESVNEINNLNFTVSKKHIEFGFKNVISNTSLKGRWQVLDIKPFIICDIAHNEDGINQVLKQIMQLKFEKLHFVFGTVDDKILDNILSILPKEAIYYFCAAAVPRALEVNTLQEKCKQYNLNGDSYESVNIALENAKTNASKNDLIFVGGSTFVIAEIENL